MSDTTMQAITQDILGGPEVLRWTTTARPQAGLGEIAVRVRAAGINPIDLKTREHGAFLGEPPFILGWDVSGVVEAVGPGVRLFKPGDEVYGMPRFPGQAGGYAQYVTGPARDFAHKPAGLSHVEAAALPLAALTARQALLEAGVVQPGQRVLIHAAAGGVGHFAVQIAKARGAYVIGTARPHAHQTLRELGADELIDYSQVDVNATVRDVDMVLDTLGGANTSATLATLKDGATLVSLPSPQEDAVKAEAAERGIAAGFMLVQPDRAGLLEITKLFEAGLLRPLIAQTFPLEQAAEAHRLAQTSGMLGKLVLTVS
ncbi:NADP-dependent oxidoreductase [Streptacidiphilus rugosus]|uniref:NADP-dependent oxidoreductase n=1 Tax=Streptacidiphilus rugosus TaxID=405783 RepID=UPI0005649972|nr:NADP-dependent oxidoreductase [Streptacidiphilus rugosus]